MARGVLAAGTGLTIAGWRIARRERGAAVALPEPWAHGRRAPGGGSLVAYHVVALLVWQLPACPVCRGERRRGRWWGRGSS
ncbi:hypothetical protein [Nannocystis exedens]|uniref:hypothetical protein n=1 Tax=Nannocystis exedens TaxID=54 RepID=UPI00117D940E|nr:hypothetical protein [Nannocystis exedens]